LYFIYDIIFIVLFILYLPFLIVKILKGKYRKGFWQRFGFIPGDELKKISTKPVIWIHAVSVGETVAASPVVQEIKRKYPDYAIVFSTVTDTGQNMAHKIIKEADAFIYFPLDLSIIIKKVLKKINPKLVIIMETELWPNFIKEADRQHISVVLANGRISDNSARTYKYLGPYLKDMLKSIDIYAMQSDQDVSYILNLGADKEKVFNTGNTKLDQNYSLVSDEQKELFYNKFKIAKGQPVLVVGSTHPNEEEQFIEVFKELKQDFNNLLMILAPRHINRTSEIEEIYSKAGIKTIRRTKIDKRKDEPVIFLDTIGELAKIYSIADIVFIGGSLIEKGGHNILEPAAHGKLVLFGPYMFNFKESTRLLLEEDAAIQVKDTKELVEKIKTFLENPRLLSMYTERTRSILESNKGASLKTMKLLKKKLEVF